MIWENDIYNEPREISSPSLLRGGLTLALFRVTVSNPSRSVFFVFFVGVSGALFLARSIWMSRQDVFT